MASCALSSLRVLAALAVSWAVVAGAAASARYPVERTAVAGWVATELPTTGDYAYGRPVAINDAGQVVGSAGKTCQLGSCLYTRPVMWQGTRMVDLRSLGGDHGAATAINGRGQVIGWSETKRGRRHAFLWQSGRMQDLGTLGGGETQPRRRSTSGARSSGWSATSSGLHHAFLWEHGRMRDLGTLGGRESEALDVDEASRVVGWSDSEPRSGERPLTIPRRAFLWSGGRMRSLGTLPPDPGSPGLDELQMEARAVGASANANAARPEPRLLDLLQAGCASSAASRPRHAWRGAISETPGISSPVGVS